MQRRVAVSVALVVATLAVYAQVRGHEFVELDDPYYVVSNPHLEEGLTLDAVGGVFAEPYFFNWAPLTLISFQIDRALHGRDPAGTLLANVALHATNAVLLYLFLAGATGATARSAFVAGLFALHPLHVESVAWASSRKDVLSGLFWMLSLLAWSRWIARPNAARYAAVFVALALGLLAKATPITLPFVLLLLDVWPYRRWRKVGPTRAVVEKAPLFALVAAAAAVTWIVQRDTLAMPELSPPLDLRILNAVHSYVVYAWKSFWPTGLSCFYPYPPAELGVGPLRAAADATLLAAITAFALLRLGAQPYLAVGWLWYLGVLLPMIGLVQTGMQLRADRYTYLPQIGLSIAVTWGMVDALVGRRGGRALLGAAAVVSLAAFGVLAWRQVGTWRDSTTLYEHALQVTEHNYFAHRGLGAVLARAGHPQQALEHYAASLDIQPGWPTSRFEAALVLLQLGRPAEALTQLDAAIQRAPAEPRYRAARGVALANLGRLDEARSELELAIAGLPEAADARAELARVELLSGNDAEALRLGRAALALQPAEPTATRVVVWVLSSDDPLLRDPDEAIRLLEAALDRAGESADLLALLGRARAAAGRFADAAVTAERALARARAEGRDALVTRLRVDLDAYRSRSVSKQAP